MKNTAFKKSLAFLMATLMLVSVFAFASCGEKTPSVTDAPATDSPATDAPVTTEPVTTVILPEVYEDADF